MHAVMLHRFLCSLSMFGISDVSDMSSDGDSHSPERKKKRTTLEYWNDKYTKDAKPVEWLDDYGGLRSFVEEVTRGNRNASILHVGCGSSNITEMMYDEGYHKIRNIDASAVVIEQMVQRNRKRPLMTWEVMDSTNMSSLQNETFDLVLDKAMLDTFLEFEKTGVLLTTATYLNEVQRVLRPGGWFICISFGIVTLEFLKFPHLAFDCRHVELSPKFEDHRPHLAYLCHKSEKYLSKSDKWHEVKQSLTSSDKNSCQKVLSWDPENAFVWTLMGLQGGGQVDDQKYSEKRCYQKALSLCPQDSTAWNNLGLLGGGKIDGQKYSQKECWERGLFTGPEEPLVWYRLSHLGGGKVGPKWYSKEECVEKAIALDPDFNPLQGIEYYYQ
eukprot:gnl/MRDRNA2_/MRDRNA2_14848_c0_seq1.p1 gnl/MRDRNA2_/MRDRNA2_14848_c0~~gnl/MRDRNA2_/MRDRNA2_14848_c0_seq1.p1  ORF type:complete len:423 (+),score=53.00 gnl/MRDRNA2_/MRDRNA2_14848_c0_seq1:115-1269(+)